MMVQAGWLGIFTLRIAAMLNFKERRAGAGGRAAAWGGGVLMIAALGLAGFAGAQAADESAGTAPPPPPAAPPAPADPATAEAEAGVRVIFDQAAAAFNDRDWPTFVECVSPPRREELIGQTALGFATLAQQPGVDPRVVELVQTHLPKNLDPASLSMGSDDPRADRVRLAKRLADPMGFFAQAMSLAFALQYADAPEEVKLTTLENLSFDEEQEHAAGEVTFVMPEAERQDFWTFEKFEEAWFLSMQQPRRVQ